MNIQQINTLYQSKVSEIKERLPQTGTVQNKFQELLEQAQLTNFTDTTAATETTTETTETDPVKLLNSLMATQSTINATSALFGSSGTDSNLFPTSSLNNSLLSLQQSALLKSLNSTTEE